MTFTPNANGTATLAGSSTASGSYPLTITAANGVLPNATQSFTLTISAAPTITSANSTTFPSGSPGSFTVTSTGSPTPALSESGALPAGVTFTPNANGTATLAGTPTASGSYPLTITAANGVLPNATQSFTLTVSPPATYTLSGTVTAGGSGLDGAMVHVVTAAGAYVTNTTTAGGGAYTLTLSPGDYKLYVQPNKPGYPNQWFDGTDVANATVIPVSANTLQNIALVGPPATYTLSGTVTAGGSGLDGALVYVVTAGDAYVSNTTTAGGGAYTFTLSPGSYKLYVQPNKPGYPNQWFDGTDVANATVIPVSANTLQNIALVGPPATYTLSGTVTAGGTGLDGALVYVVTAGDAYVSNTTTAGGGAYTLTLSPGDYKLYVQPNEPGYPDQWFGGTDVGSATVIHVSSNTLQNIVLVGPPLSGTVTAAGIGLDGALVYVVTTAGAFVNYTTTAGGGAYTFTLAPGDYKLYIQPNEPGYPDQWFGGTDVANATVIPVSANTLQNIALVGP